jgi:hypothetical protein
LIRFVNIGLLLSALFLLNFSAWAQEDLDLPVDEENDSIVKEKHPSKKAMLYSALLPGAGQVYNHMHLPKSSRRKWNVYWKVPLIYGALGGSLYMLGSQQRMVVDLRREFRFRENNNGAFQNPKFFNLDNQSIILLHNQTQTTRDLFILSSVLVYVINILDATVEAHFINFDVSDDLSMHIYPTATPNFQLGFGMSLRFKK